MINQETIERIKNAVDIVEVIGDFVQLKKSGQSYKGLSPFGNEKTPSFFVSPGKGIYKDFSSGKGGDAIKFIMEHEGLSYVEALKYLASKYGIEIEERQQTPEELASQSLRESLFIVLNFAKDYYKELLHEHETGRSIGLSYFRERGLSDEIINEFELGYSLDEWDGLSKAASAKHYNLDVLEKAGLIVKKDNKTYDRFRGRVIFPVHNLTGKVIAYGARILTNAKNQPKYINSPETEVYHKSNVLYGMFQAKNHIRNEDNCYLVEGYTDVLSLSQGQIKNVVGSSGTALTTEQIKLIGRYTKNVTVLYDGDKAGIKASLRGIDLILEQGLDVHAVTFPEGQDPDSYIKEIGATAFKEYLDKNGVDFITFKTRLFLDEAGEDPLKKAQVIHTIIDSIAKVNDPIKRNLFFQQCSNLLNIDESILISEYNKIHLKKRKQEREENANKQQEALTQLVEKEIEEESFTPEAVLSAQEREVMRLLISYGDQEVEEGTLLAHYILPEIEDVEFQSPQFRELAALYYQQLDDNGKIDNQDLLDSVNDELKNAVVDLMMSPYEISENWEKYQIYVTNETDDLAKVTYTSILRLKWRKLRVMLKEIQSNLLEAKVENEIEELQVKFIRLKEMEMSIAKLLGNVTIG